MRRQDIEPGRFYEVALARSGRGGGRIDEKDIVKDAEAADGG